MKNSKRLCFVLSFMLFTSCNWGHEKSIENATKTNASPQQVDSAKIMYNEKLYKAKTGVGPIKTKVKLGDRIDQNMAKKGEKLFNNKCSTCHSIHENSIGPALGGVLSERSPQWVMNMILNPKGMIENNIHVKAMKGLYETRMVDLELSEKEARQIVEYLRTY